uniref:ABC-type xenobiotic transporter n=1 Tax=Cajanus cajan TaxID=3821 RepID=A0A151U6H3_CAJCA|nr:ABC transporter C family member 10 [Cajanus cajan]
MANGSLGLIHLCLSIWFLEENLRRTQTALPLDWWMLEFIQGLTWLLVGFIVCLQLKQLPRAWLLMFSVVMFLVSGILCALSLFYAISSRKLSLKVALDVLSFPGVILLLLCIYKESKYRDNGKENNESLYTPLKEESNKVDSIGYVTLFAKAGVFSRMSFWWLNPLMKRGKEKTLQDEDIPKLGEADQAESCHESFKYEGYVLAISLVFTKIIESLSQRQWYFRTRLIGLKVRSLLIAAIYKKQLRLSNAARLMHSGGEIMNYVNVDANRIGEFPYWFHQTWTTSVQLCIALVVLFRAVGLATFASLAVIVLTVICNTPLAKLQHKFQRKLMVAQDERLKATSEALVSMKVLKLYAWETNFRNAIERLRGVELKRLSVVQLRRSYSNFLFWASPVLVSAASFGACYLLNVPLHANNVFTFVATLRLVQDPIRTIPDVIGVVIQAKVAFARIVKFLEAPELQSENANKCFSDNMRGSISINSADFSWEDNMSKPTLRNIKMEVTPGQKVAICGEVGSGKSTLLAAILREVPITRGTIEVHGKFAYVSQTAWIQTGTIRENILFGSDMDAEKYQETLHRCSLEKDLELFPHGDLTEIGERGVNLSGGQKQRIQLARALYQNADIYLLDDPCSAVDAHTAANLFKDYIMEGLVGKTVLLVTHQVDFLPAFDSVLLMSNGEIIQAASYHHLLSSSQEFQDLVNAHKETAGSDRLLDVTSSKRHSNTATEIRFKPHLQYLNQDKGYIYFSVASLSHLIFVIGQIFQNLWMASNVDNPYVSSLQLIAVYLLIGFISACFLFIRSLVVVAMSIRSSKSLFLQLISSLFRAPMSFYDSTPLGRILSRVSSDLSIVDLDVPFGLIFAVGATTTCYTNLAVIAAITWQVLFISLPMLYIAFRLQRYYYATAKELMRLNGTTKSFVANHLAESIAGAVTIRAFEEEDRFFAKNLDLIDVNASPYFHTYAANEWLMLRLETISAVVFASAALCMVVLPPGTFTSGFIGMALSYGLSLNSALVFAIQNQCTLANQIISVERLNQYMHIPSEAPEVVEGNRPPENWPAEGKVELHDLKIRYRPDTPLVLRGITCTFEGGHKIGVVGRTGSGKSTLTGALFRLVEPAGGKIIVDGIDICSIGLHDLRSRFGIIPQDPTLFNGTVRYNMDPLAQHSDQEIWEVLGKCQLREVVEEKEEGLDSSVVEAGANWSMGQRQLFCLGRALLRRSRILVLDEATASIDNATDLILQKTIRTEFADCTVITVAHRIPTVMDCTKVVSIRELVEYDEPMNLMEREGSLFGQLVKEYWSHLHLNSKERSREMAGFWSMFCGESGCSEDGRKPCSYDYRLLIDPSTCINHLLISCFDVLLLIMLVLIMVQKSTLKPSRGQTRGVRRYSYFQLVSAIANGALGLAHLCLGIWVLEERYRKTQTVFPLNWWLLEIFHGLTWLLVSLTISLKLKQLPRALTRLFSVLILLVSGIFCASSLFYAISSREPSLKMVSDMLSFPGAILLLLCTYKESTYKDTDNEVDESLYAPLNGESNKKDSIRYVTPFARAGFLSGMSFWWLNQLMKMGKEKTLQDEDIPRLREKDRAESCYLLFLDQLNRQKQKDPFSEPSVLRTILLCHWKEILISGFFALLKVLSLSSGPLLLNSFILVAEGNESFKYEGFVLAVSLFSAKIIESLSQRQWYFRCRLIGLKVRSLLTAAIYRKQLRLSNSARLMHSGGEIMNYVTVDAYRIGEFPYWFHQTWTTSFQLCISLVILFRAVGMATIASLVVIVITVLCNTPLAKLQHKFQSKLMVAQDERLKACSEALVNMKVLKLYAWETNFRNAIERLRNEELKWLSAVQLRKAYNTFLFWSSPVLVSAASFGACYFLNVPLHANNVFTFVATLRLVQDPIRTIPDVIGVIIQAKVAFTRIVKFLEAPELQSTNVTKRSLNDNMRGSILIKSADFSWVDNVSKPTLRNINLEVRPGQKMAICGEVGSGKSTLLAAILREVPNTRGTIQVSGKFAYVSQTAWIQTGTIRENILFGAAMDAEKYRQTLHRSSLLKDLELFPHGDLTEIGERGVNLSGGQKQRIQLARALYQNADIYLLDDPFSAVDAHTATNLFNEYIMGGLAGKTVLLVTHQVDFLPAFDSVLLMSDGEIIEAAPYHHLLSSSHAFQELVNAHKETAGSDRLVDVTSSQKHSNSAREIKKTYMENHFEASKGDQLIKQEEREKGDQGFKPYIQYLNQNKGYIYFSVAALSHLTFVVGQILQNTWMADSVDNPRVSSLQLILVYLLIGVISTIFLLVRSLVAVALGLQSSKSLFFQLLNSLFRAPMAFYDSTPLGRILSRVSSDLSIVDLDVPFGFLFSVGATMNCYANLTVLAVVTWQVLFVSIPMIYFAIRLQRYYFASAKELMRMNGTTKSFVANHLAESVAGAVTIRAFDEEDRFFKKNLDLIDVNASPFFHSFAANEWLIQRLETVSAVVLASAALCMVVLPPGTFTSGFIGMALSYGLSLNNSLAPEVIEGNRPPVNWPVAGRVQINALQVLGKCQLQEAVQEKEEGLDSSVVEAGANWSMGQRQLFCLGRALLRRSRILVLDEATASIDNATDLILQKSIRTEFADCTVITVAHRIPTVMDCTKVLAISDGKLVEYDEPMKLIKREGSLFGKLVKEYWSHFQSAESH